MVWHGPVRRRALSIAAIGEVAHFTVAGANALTHTSIGITFDIDGTRTPNAGTTAQAFLAVMASGGTAAQFVASYNDFGNETSAESWLSYSLDSSVPDRLTFNGAYDLLGATNDLNIFYRLVATSGWGTVDYCSTGRFGFVLPDNVTYTSNSGVFPTAGAPGVPEPAAWAMMIVGFGAVGGATRYCRRKLGIRYV